MVGMVLDTLVREEMGGTDAGVNLVAGFHLLLHLCDPTLYGADTAAAACAAIAALLADGHGAQPHLGWRDSHRMVHTLCDMHSGVIIAAAEHAGLVPKLAQHRNDAVTVLAAAAYQDPNTAPGPLRQEILHRNTYVLRAFEAGALQVSSCDMFCSTGQVVGSATGAGGVSDCLCAVAAAAAGQRQLQQFSLALADILATAAAQNRSAMAVQPLAAVARALRVASGGFGQSCGAEGTRDGGDGRASLDSSSVPATVESMRSPQGAQLLHTRVAVLAAALTLATSWFDSHGLLSRLLQREVGGVLSTERLPMHVW